MRRPVFVLVDCNNFFASCERVFRPDLKDKPVAVLSNNDGCVVARSNEVKALGVPMAVPYFKVRQTLENAGTAIFSANFALYGDFSRRVVEILTMYTPDIEVYSVDESFLEVSSLLVDDYQSWAENLRDHIYQWIGIPVSVGVAPTKTLAKAASERAKRDGGFNGALSLVGNRKLTQETLEWLEIEDVWGIGRRLAPRLRGIGMRNARQLSEVSDKWALETLTVRGLRTVKELRGESCIPLDNSHGRYLDNEQKSIATTRIFGHTIRSGYELESAVATFSARLGAKLRRLNQLAGNLIVFLRTGPKAEEPYYPSIALTLPYPTADTAQLIHTAMEGLRRIYDPDYAYKRAGVVITSLYPADAQQLPLIDNPGEAALEARKRVMQAIDTLNRKYGKGTIVHAVESASKRRWHSKNEQRSPSYTTSWFDLPKVTV